MSKRFAMTPVWRPWALFVAAAAVVSLSVLGIAPATAGEAVWVNACGAGSVSIDPPSADVGPQQVMRVKTWTDGATRWWGTEVAANCTIVREQPGTNTRPKPSLTHLRVVITQADLDDICAGEEVTLANAAFNLVSGTWDPPTWVGFLTFRGTGQRLAVHYHAGNLGTGPFVEGFGTFTMEGATPCAQDGAQWMGGLVAADPEVDTTP